MFSKVLVLALAAMAMGSPANSKVPSHLLQLKSADIFVIMADRVGPVLNRINSLVFDNREARIMAVASSLQSHAANSQKSVLDFLKTKSNDVTSFWINNQIFVKSADPSLILELASFDSVASIRQNEFIKLEPIQISESGTLAEWGIENIQANLVWSMPGGTVGEGVRVCTIDTGARGTHEALAPSYLGTYGWFDPADRTTTPNDSNGHGTHTTGTIAGVMGIGVAPGAKWQACKGCATSSCSNADLLKCGEWVVCPTLPDDTTPNCAMAPHIVSNSWAGGQGQNWYDDVISVWHASDIIPVFANGNNGQACNSANSPADSQAGVIAVGSTTSSNGLSSFSSRGPSAFLTLKPDISAPGSDVRSSYSTADNAYASLSGTSMACPHVAGVVALLRSINPSLDYTQISNILYGNADTNVTPTNQNCGGVVDTTYPNHSYGFGKVNAFKAAQAAIATKA